MYISEKLYELTICDTGK